MSEIDALLQEDRSFEPTAEFRAKAHVSDPEVYARAATDPEAFWANFAAELEWMQPWSQVLDWNPPHARVVRRRQAERERQLSRPARAHVAAQQGRVHLGRRARRSAHADLLRSLSAGVPVRERAEGARRRPGRSRGALHAARPRAGHRHAGLRADRRRSLRRLRRVLGGVVARSHQRRAGPTARHRRRRLPPRRDRPAQADGR